MLRRGKALDKQRLCFCFRKAVQHTDSRWNHKPTTMYSTRCDWRMVVDGSDLFAFSIFSPLRAIADAREDPGVTIIENLSKWTKLSKKIPFYDCFFEQFNAIDFTQKIANLVKSRIGCQVKSCRNAMRRMHWHSSALKARSNFAI